MSSSAVYAHYKRTVKRPVNRAGHQSKQPQESNTPRLIGSSLCLPGMHVLHWRPVHREAVIAILELVPHE